MTTLDGPRPGRPEDYDAIVESLNAIFRTAAGRAPTIAVDWPHVYDRANLHNARIVTAGERVAASAAIWPNDVLMGEIRLRVGGVNCVGVLPEYRKHGLGRQVMQAIQARLRELGCHVGLLVTDIDNWYRALGWERAGMRRLYRIDRGNVGLLPDLPEGVRLRQGSEADLPAVLQIYARARLGGLRTLDTTRCILTSPQKAAAIYLAEQGEHRRGYIMMRDKRIVEWGGEAEVIGGLIRTLFYELDNQDISSSERDANFRAVRMQSITVLTPCQGHLFIDVMDLLGIPYLLDYAGMMYLVDPPAILAAVGADGVQMREQDGWFIAEWEGMQHPFSRNGLTKLFFGPEHTSITAPDVFPLPFWQWPLEGV